MNSELIVKDVEFHGDMLRAAQDPDGKVWVGVRWMCQGIGFGEDKIDNERKKIQKDVVISQGVKFHSLGSGNSNTKVLCLDLDYVPLWLAKIAITPTMQRENPVLVNKLIDYPVEEWHGGKVHFIKPSIIHLMRGQVFDIDGLKFFTFGGASSHDISDGVLEIDDPRVKEWRDDPDKMYRINHISWWEREMPNQEEMDEGIKNLAEHDNKVDFILTHCTASSTAALLSHGLYKPDKLTNYFEEIRCNVDYKRWLCGHYHDNKAITIKDIVLYEQIVRIA